MQPVRRVWLAEFTSVAVESFGMRVTWLRNNSGQPPLRPFVVMWRAWHAWLNSINNINPLNAELNPICHLLALLEAHRILHVSRARVKVVMESVHVARIVTVCSKFQWQEWEKYRLVRLIIRPAPSFRSEVKQSLRVPVGWGPHISSQSAHIGCIVVSPTHRPPLPYQEIFLVIISLRGWVDPRAVVLSEGLSMEISSDTFGYRTRDSLACSAVSQPTVLPRALFINPSNPPVVTICTTSLTFSNSTCSPHSVFMCFVWIWE
jgi:hypothetical protein